MSCQNLMKMAIFGSVIVAQLILNLNKEFTLPLEIGLYYSIFMLEE